MNKKESMYDFRIIFQKLAELNSSKEEFATCDQLIESDEINKLREIVLDVSDKEEQHFSTA